MDVYRTGAQKNYGTKKLITCNGQAIRPSKYLNRWEADRAAFVFSTTGEDRGNSYRYRVRLGLEEMLHFLTVGVESCAETKAERTIGIAAITTLRELLSAPEQEAD